MTTPLTLKQVSQWTPEEVNRRIAERMDYEWYTGLNIQFVGNEPGSVKRSGTRFLARPEEAGVLAHYCSKEEMEDLPLSKDCMKGIPNYSASLDAMAQAEATLTYEEHEAFRDWMFEQFKHLEFSQRVRLYTSAPAEVRARAFLLAKEGGR